jgi:hypothetical protein
LYYLPFFRKSIKFSLSFFKKQELLGLIQTKLKLLKNSDCKSLTNRLKFFQEFRRRDTELTDGRIRILCASNAEHLRIAHKNDITFAVWFATVLKQFCLDIRDVWWCPLLLIQSAEHYFHHSYTVPAAPPGPGFLDFHFQISVPNEFIGPEGRANIYVSTNFHEPGCLSRYNNGLRT